MSDKNKKFKNAESSSSVGNEKTRRRKRSKSTSSSSSSSDSSSSTDSELERKRRRKEKKRAKKLKKKLDKIKKKELKAKKEELKCKNKMNEVTNDVPLELMIRSKAMAPMTKEEWEKKQSVIRRVYDEETGRHRLIKGDGEILEEIVSRDRHKEINRQATQGDGNYFQSKSIRNRNR